MKKSATEKKNFLQNPHHRPCIAHNVGVRNVRRVLVKEWNALISCEI